MQINVFDKRNDRSFLTNIINVAAENRLYEFEIDGMIGTIEPSLADFESKVSVVVRKILQTNGLGSLTTNERFLIAAFVSLQILRSPNHRAMRHQILESMRDRVRQMGGDLDAVPQLRLFTANEEKLFEAQAMNKTVRKFIPVIVGKVWMLHVVPKARHLYISDNPVAMHNERDLSPRGSIGLAVDGVEVYVPLSATHCLAMFCPSVCETFRRKLSLYTAWPKSRPLPPELETGRAQADEWRRAFEAGSPVTMRPEAVDT